MSVQFDTLRYVEKLKSAGVPEAQAKAQVEAMADALAESANGVLATKDDIHGLDQRITDVKLEIAEVKSDLRLLKWMVGILLAGVLSLVVNAFVH